MTPGDRGMGDCKHCGGLILVLNGWWTHPVGNSDGSWSSLIRCQAPAPYGTDAEPVEEEANE